MENQVQVHYADFNTRLGVFRIAADSKGLVCLRLLGKGNGAAPLGWRRDSARFKKEKAALRNYAQGHFRALKELPCPFGEIGTPYQRKVWQRLRRIPPGRTVSYGEVAASIGSPGGARAVGAACRANPLMLLVPCHRVIGASGKLTGFASGLDLKTKLLKLENQVSLTADKP